MSKNIVVICSREKLYARMVVNTLIRMGNEPKLIISGSRYANKVKSILVLRRYFKKDRLVAAIRNIRLVRKQGVNDGKQHAEISTSIPDRIPRYQYDFINHGEIASLIARTKPDVVVLAGAEIVSEGLLAWTRVVAGNTIWINAHPALLPGIRGLDVVEWAEHLGQTQGITVHSVGAKVDTGEIHSSVVVERNAGESFRDFRSRMLGEQALILAKTAIRILEGDNATIPNDVSQSSYHSTMDYARRKLVASI